MYKAKAYSAASATSPLKSTTITRRDPTERDVQMEILFCGICHSDLHQVKNRWNDARRTVYPCVPGHEIVGRVTKVGSEVTNTPGDLAAVGCMVDASGICPECEAGLEQFCPNFTPTYSVPDKHLGGVTYGGYSDSIVVGQRFVLSVPANLNLAGAAPLLCDGIATYSPMRHWGVTKGKKVGVVGLGGLGHMGVQFAHALGAHVLVFTTSPRKKEDAFRLGADEVVVSTNAGEMQAPQQLRLHSRLRLGQSRHQHLHQPLAPGWQHHSGRRTRKASGDPGIRPIMGRRSLSGSPIGGIAETQEMCDFCGPNNITADVEVIPIQKLNEADERLVKSDVKYRDRHGFTQV